MVGVDERFNGDEAGDRIVLIGRGSGRGSRSDLVVGCLTSLGGMLIVGCVLTDVPRSGSGDGLLRRSAHA